MKSPNEDFTMFFGTNCWLIFIRLHHFICERLAGLKKCAHELIEEYLLDLKIREHQNENYQKQGRNMESQILNAIDVNLGLRDLKKPLQNPKNFYMRIIQELKNFLDGIIDNNAFEEIARYFLFYF